MKTPNLSLVLVTLVVAAADARGQPWITTQPIGQSVSLNATVQFRVVPVSSGGAVTFQWWFKDAALDPAANPSAAKNTLLMSNVTEAAAGPYWAVVSDDNGSALSETAELDVDSKFVVVTGGGLEKLEGDMWCPYWVDFDGDGWLELVIAGGWNTDGGKRLLVYENDRGGTLTADLTHSLAGASYLGANLAWGDYDNDGDLDAFLAQLERQPACYLVNDGGGTFTHLAADRAWTVNGIPVHGSSAACSDYDMDGWLDLIVGFWGNYATGQWGTNTVLHGVGGGRFEVDLASALAVSRTWPEHWAWADSDGDGDPDLLCATSGYSSQHDLQFENEGGGNFVPVTTGPLVEIQDMSVAPSWADYDNDGDLDVLATGWGRSDLLYRNDGHGILDGDPNGPQRAGSAQPKVGAWGDYDNDGHLDLFIAHQQAASRLFHNQGDGTFNEVFTGSPVHECRGYGAAWGDYDNDGFLDRVVVNEINGRKYLYRNNQPAIGNPNRWLKIRLHGASSNQDGNGAKVRVKANIGDKTVWQLRQIVSQSHQVELLAHFGLGDATQADVVRIEWPSGIVQELTNVAAGQVLTITEHQEYGGAPPRFTKVTPSAEGCQVVIAEPEANARYVLEASTDLVSWTKRLARTSTGGTHEFLDTHATNQAVRFYRLVVP